MTIIFLIYWYVGYITESIYFILERHKRQNSLIEKFEQCVFNPEISVDNTLHNFHWVLYEWDFIEISQI